MMKTALFTLLTALVVTEQAFAFSPLLLQVPSARTSASRSSVVVLAAAEEASTETTTQSSFDSYEAGQSEIVYKDTASGEGDRTAEEGDVLTINYVGTLFPSGQEFNKNEDFVFEIGGGNALPGFETALKGVKVGSKRVLRIPPSKAYGERGVPGSKIPPNADLEFDCEIKAIARGQPEVFIAKFGMQRLIGLAVCTLILDVSPMFS